MLSLLAAVMLASSPTPSSLSLLALEDGPAHSARLLVAQAPETGIQEVPVPSTPFRTGAWMRASRS
ncbi:hypothetical protein D7X30_15465 [Corallococcus sp. AB011P]|nr:hypothetical protein D7X30_15465 [Corallococcus sp. AB011P]